MFCLTSSISAMEGYSFYEIHTFLQKTFSKKRQSNTRTPAHRAKKDNSEEIDAAHQAVHDYALIKHEDSAGTEETR